MSRRARRPCRFRPGLEPLEDRRLPAVSGFSPAQIAQAYGINQVALPAGQLAGAGQTIAIFQNGDDPKFVNSADPAFATSDLAVFDRQYGLPDPPSFTVIGYDPTTGQVVDRSQVQPVKAGSGEYPLDVEWAHATAPGANIIVVEELLPPSPAPADQAATEQFAASLPGVSVVSTSYGHVEFATEAQLDGDFLSPSQTFDPSTGQTTPGHGGVTFVAASGDEKDPNNPGTPLWQMQWPAASPNVLAVGATALTLDGSNNYQGETAWAHSQGGASADEPAAAYQTQAPADATANRLVPDVAMVGASETPVSVYDSLNHGGWFATGGTSVGAPIWSGMIAVADQLRAAAGLGSLDGATQALPLLYRLTPAGNPGADFRATTTVDNPADLASNDPRADPTSLNPSYNEYTGLGSPIANLLLPALAQTHLTVSGLPSSAVAGTPVPLTVTVSDALGDVASGYRGTVHFSSGDGLAGLPADYTFTAADAGSHTFTVTFNSLGTQTLSVTYTGGAVTGGSAATTVGVTPVVSVAVGPRGQEVLVVVSPNGTLTQIDATGVHLLGGGVRSAGVAFGPRGEVLLVTELNGTLIESDATGVHPLGGGVRSAGVAFGPRGEVLALVTQAGTLIQLDATGVHVLGGGIASADVAFEGSREVLLVITQGGELLQFGPSAVEALGSGYLSAAAAFGPAGELLDLIFPGDALFQFQAGRETALGQIT